MTIADYLIVPADEIDYSGLDLELLHALAVQQEDPFIATRALGELSRRSEPAAARASEAILRAANGDRFLVAFAIATLFEADIASAHELAQSLVAGTEDPVVLGGVVESVLANPDRFHDDQGRALVTRLVQQMRRVVPDDSTHIDDWTAFLKQYG